MSVNLPVPELLAPAGNVDKLKVALHFGADAVYLGLKRLSLRSFAGNFGWDELEWSLQHAHGLGRRVYIAVNLQPFDQDFEEIESTLRRLEQLRPDGVIVADGGVLDLARSACPHVPIHLSTQTSVTNTRQADFWFRQGVRRICVARELTVEQLHGLAHRSPGEIEAFVHGAICVAYSGRCFLSLYWADRDPRRGECAGACRWPYKLIEDRRRPGEPNRVEADERGTYFFDAKDLCALPVLDRLVSTGVRSLKIEGRTRSEHYVAVAVDVYRDALDHLARGDLEGFTARRDLYMAELARNTNRGFSLHFLAGEVPGPDAYNPQGSRLARENHYVGRVVRCTNDSMDVELRNHLHKGDTVQLRSPGLRFHTLVVQQLLSLDGLELDMGRAPNTVRIPGNHPAQEGTLVRFENVDDPEETRVDP